MNLQSRAALYNYVMNDGPTPDFVYEDFMNEMPYGTSKARTGDPDNWLADHFDQVIERYYSSLLNEAEGRNEMKKFIVYAGEFIDGGNSPHG